MRSGILDSISQLPDSALCRILSFLETKGTVQTSILSKRWRYLWASVPALDLTDESFFRNGDERLEDSDTYSFENFVDTVLLLRDASDLHSFTLLCYDYSDECHLHRWIRYAAKCNTKVLHIELPKSNDCHLPLGILPFRSLEELIMTLHYRVVLGPPKIMGHLRRLHIQFANLRHGKMENLISSCPILEDLDLFNCGADALCISSNTLKRLSVNCCRFDPSGNLISTPGLEILTYTNNSCGSTLKNLSSLLNAKVHTTGGDAVELSKGLAYVETLNFTILNFYQCKLPEDLSQFPIFFNLTSLTLGGECTSDMIQVAALFLQNSPNLKMFTLNTRQESPLSQSRWKFVQISKFSFRSPPQLQLIEIQCSKMEENLHELIKYLLLNATGVPKIGINRVGHFVTS